MKFRMRSDIVFEAADFQDAVNKAGEIFVDWSNSIGEEDFTPEFSVSSDYTGELVIQPVEDR